MLNGIMHNLIDESEQPRFIHKAAVEKVETVWSTVVESNSTNTRMQQCWPQQQQQQHQHQHDHHHHQLLLPLLLQ